MTIEIEANVADLLAKLRVQAKAHGLTFEAYLQQFIEPVQPDSANAVSLLEFDRVLNELAQTPISGPSLPADFSRADIYADHN
jgi:hypothetical protein